MITLLQKLFIKDHMSEEEKRTAMGTLCGGAGIFLNIVLFALKFFAGLLSGAVSIMADAFNNLSDAGSSLITILGFKLAGQKPDLEHPYGHGRIEYISGFIVAILIVVMGFELIKESIGKILHPEAVDFSIILVVILVASIGVKLYMAFFNTSAGKKIGSAPLKATGMDSLSDSVATAVVLACTLVNHFTGLNLDGWCGVLVSLFIFYAGFTAGKEALNPLLGNPPEEEFVHKISDIVTHFDEQVVGIHDLMVHDYGPGRVIISLHAEVPADGDILEIHDVIDNLEHKLREELGCVATIHMDPIVVNDPKVIELREKVREIATEVGEDFSIHDFRVVFGDTHTNLIFDMAVPLSCSMDNDEILAKTRALIFEKISERHFAVIEIDRENYIY